ncbi:microsomal triacylglycerol transfer protein-like [Planococcus citri]|uniref:microsomal triacylglycerol transfer protein-like n=1 Tax=Planococcus citri TaxID=170843 RepID=UPI0031F84E8C
MLTNVSILIAYFSTVPFRWLLLLIHIVSGSLHSHPEAELDLFTDSAVDRLYAFDSIIRLNEVHKSNSESDLAFQTTGNVQLSVIWQNPDDRLEKLLQFRIDSLKITLIKYQKNSSWKFEEQPTKSLDDLKNDVFLVHWKNFKILNIYLNPEEDVSLRNIKKSLASLFQFQKHHIHTEECDICGLCSVTYELIVSKTILKTKNKCISNLPDNQHPEKMLGTNTNVSRRVLYQFDDDKMSNLVRATLYENIDLNIYIKREIGASATASMDLSLIGTNSSTTNRKMLPYNSYEKVIIITIANLDLNLEPDNLYIIEEPIQSTVKPLPKVIKDNEEYLKSNNLGNATSASAFLAVLRSVLQSSELEISEVLKNKENELIIEQLMDVLGSAQTLPAHKSVLNHFNFVNPGPSLDAVERYLWSLSVAKKPKIEFVRDLKNIINQKPNDVKLLDSLVLCLTAMARKISDEVALEVYSFITEKMSQCKQDDPCKITFIRSLKNLGSPHSKSLLLDFALNGTRSVTVNALKVLYVLPHSSWDEQVLSAMEKIYYQKDKKYDSSSRVIAVDILLEADPSEQTVRHLVKSLLSHSSFEIRKYLLQRLNQIASNDQKFSNIFKRLMREENMNHYGILAQRGLSNVLRRTFSEDPSVNATLFCVNEISKSVLKKGHVGVSLQRFNDTLEVGALDIFTDGLSSFLWSDDTTTVEDELDEPEDLTAGLEASVLGVQIRPFVFFDGHVQLMGHIFSGTASEKTTALQGTALLQEVDQMIALGTGNILRVQLNGAGSYDLSGQIQFSLWKRNAHALVEAAAGGSIEGTLNVSSSFVKNGVDFKVYSQQKGEMTGDLDFQDEKAFCLRISQLDSEVRSVGEKYQKLEETKFVHMQKRRSKVVVPGRTFALNQNNNEMCNDILKKQPS